MSSVFSNRADLVDSTSKGSGIYLVLGSEVAQW